ncbi:S41 family peptidase [Robiginitalea sp. M366]|uniref:S41 family peptidase n=1 Tax=Robiginitalea aestuariiviva TaxID=3036903 RepID=UPI00240DE91C|nr:S41 family peptidase [Robiginitalea aestuariiviva]MDG1573493.1 S41 family peptidase [Robiginitalea aestuariiviva]
MKKFAYALAALMVVACSKDNETNPGPDPVGNLDVQDFMWKAMNIWYYWQQDVPDLADTRFSTDAEYTQYLASETDPAVFFQSLLFSADRFSFLSEDYVELTQNLSGVSRSNGLEFGLTYQDANSNGALDPSDPVYGTVRYIVPNSSAAAADIARGEVFVGVDGQAMNGGNYRDLLFGDNASYTLQMADVQGGVITPNGKEVPLTKEENLVENPVYIAKTLDVQGQKVAYLMYNGFTNEFDEDLNAAFGTFVAEGATDLVLDLRYNSGGSVNSSRLLSSMIFGRRTQDVYLVQRWNDRLQQIFTQDDPDALTDYFAATTGAGSTINTLNLQRVYILTTRSTASSSELVINGLNPYIDVVTIGTTTTGKNEFSLTMVDDPDRQGAPYIYTSSRESQINPNNSWAIQPLVGRNENSAGFSDYTSGFPPDIELREDLENMGVLGEVTEPLLARALEEITGISGKRSFEVCTPDRPFTHSKMFKPLRDNMYVEPGTDFQLPDNLLKTLQ